MLEVEEEVEEEEDGEVFFGGIFAGGPIDMTFSGKSFIPSPGGKSVIPSPDVVEDDEEEEDEDALPRFEVLDLVDDDEDSLQFLMCL